MMTTLAWWILWLPFIVAGIIAFFLIQRPKIAGVLATLGMLAAFTMTCMLFMEFSKTGLEKTPYESSITWIPLQGFRIEFGVLINNMTLLMLGIVTGIGTLIFLFSTSYMKDDKGYARFFASLSLFAFSMLGIVLSNNLIQIFIFWELVGLSSYLLIGFWFEKNSASTAGKKAFLTTRVGDVGMMIGILLLTGFLAKAGIPTFNFLELERTLASAAIPAAALTAISLLIFMGVMGKSAQVPLHVWLPDAMEGPTPVSALIHAATMVAAGVFLLARLFFLFSASHDAMQIIAWTGGITALLAGTVAVVQNDIKKVLAYSTLSQLGYMVMALGLGNAEAGMFHLTTHAFFKALLFLGSASLIHAMHTQDVWEMEEGLLKKMPVTSLTFLIGTLALMGVPPMSGFFSKEEVLAAAYQGSMPLFWLAISVVFFTSFYMGRLCTIVFFRKREHAHGHHDHGHAHESGWEITLPLIILAVLSAVSGFLPIKELLPAGPEHHGHGGHAGGHFIAFLSIGLVALGAGLSFFLYRTRKISVPASGVGAVLEKKYFFDDFYDAVVIKGIQENAAAFLDLFERKVVVEFFANGTAKISKDLGNILRKLQTGVVQFYALSFAAGLTVILYCVILWRHP